MTTADLTSTHPIVDVAQAAIVAIRGRADITRADAAAILDLIAFGPTLSDEHRKATLDRFPDTDRTEEPTWPYVRVDTLFPGNHIVYNGREFAVCEVLPAAQPPTTMSVIGRSVDTGRRKILLYANPSAVAEMAVSA